MYIVTGLFTCGAPCLQGTVSREVFSEMLRVTVCMCAGETSGVWWVATALCAYAQMVSQHCLETLILIAPCHTHQLEETHTLKHIHYSGTLK